MSPEVLATCTKCGSSTDIQRLRTIAHRGRMYLHLSPTDAIEPSGLCGQCRAELMQWHATLGYDLHNHDINTACGINCMSRLQGRRLQIASMRSAGRDTKKGFLLAKSMDGMPTVNGTALLVTLRIYRFLNGLRQECYGPIPSAVALRDAVQRTDRLASIGVHPSARDGHFLCFEVFESARSAPRGIISEPLPGDRSLGGHCVHVTGCSDDGQLLQFWNNWGNGWGQHGYGWISLDYLSRYYLESWCVWQARWGPHPYKPDLLSDFDEGDRKELRRRWMIENWRFRQSFGDCRPGDSWKLESFVTVSRSDGAELQVLEIRNGFGLQMGWTFVAHDEQRNLSQIRELFVMPAMRGQGIGSVLEGLAAEQATAYGSTEIQLLMNDCDSVVGPIRGKARRFGQNRGYTWLWRRLPELRSVAVGVKST